MKYTVDRIEAGIAVLEAENGSFINVPRKQLPDDIRDGSILLSQNGSFIKDISSEEKRRAQMYEKQQRLLGKQKNN